VFFIIPILAILFIYLKISSAERIDEGTISESSETLLKRISNMQIEIGGIKQHITDLSSAILTKQIELNEKEQIRQRLDKEIEEKSDEADSWTSMTNKQKDIVISTVISGMKPRRTFWMGIIFGFLINLMATLTWTLLGNPGQDQIVKKFNDIIGIFF
jgi:regulator of replication initiation timing